MNAGPVRQPGALLAGPLMAGAWPSRRGPGRSARGPRPAYAAAALLVAGAGLGATAALTVTAGRPIPIRCRLFRRRPTCG